MRDNHIFSKSYTERKEAVLTALRREELAEASAPQKRIFRFGKNHAPMKILASIAVLSALTVSVYAAVQLIEFNMEQNGDEVRIHASLNENGNTDQNGEKPLRSWRAEDGEISVSLNIPDLPVDMTEDLTANGKYGSGDSSRSITINGIDLRRSDLDQIIGGATETKHLTVGGKDMYVITKGEADYYSRIAYIVFDEDELVLKLWVSYGITDDELNSLASTMTVEYTTDVMLAIPIQGEVPNSDVDIPFVIVSEDEQVYISDLAEIGESVRDEDDRFTVTFEGVETYDNVNVLDPNCILRRDYVERFSDDAGNLVPYTRTDVVYIESAGKEVSKTFGESVTAKKKLYVFTLSMTDVDMSEFSESDGAEMLEASVNSFKLYGYYSNAESDNVVNIKYMNTVVDRKPDAHADSSEIVYREYLGNGQWKVAYLIDEDIAEGNLMLYYYNGSICVKVK